MANLVTTDAVLTAYFDTDKVCDKLELATNLDGQHQKNLAMLDAKHAAATDFNESDLEKMVAALEQYLFKAGATLATSDAVLTAFFSANNVCDKIEAATNIDTQHIRDMTMLDAKHAATTPFTWQDRGKMVAALQAYLRKAI